MFMGNLERIGRLSRHEWRVNDVLKIFQYYPFFLVKGVVAEWCRL